MKDKARKTLGKKKEKNSNRDDRVERDFLKHPSLARVQPIVFALIIASHPIIIDATDDLKHNCIANNAQQPLPRTLMFVFRER